jgi:hypothetical protein
MPHDVDVATETPMIAATPSSAATHNVWLKVGNDAA